MGRAHSLQLFYISFLLRGNGRATIKFDRMYPDGLVSPETTVPLGGERSFPWTPAGALLWRAVWAAERISCEDRFSNGWLRVPLRRWKVFSLPVKRNWFCISHWSTGGREVSDCSAEIAAAAPFSSNVGGPGRLPTAASVAGHLSREGFGADSLEVTDHSPVKGID